MSDWRSGANILNEFPSRMKNVSANNFGIAMAYLVPGLIALGGVSTYSETISGW